MAKSNVVSKKRPLSDRPFATIVSGKSRTHQSFRKECDINTIMDRYAKTGFLVDPSIKSKRTPLVGDLSNIGDFHELQSQILRAKDNFMKIPSKLRERFSNDPGKFLAFMEDPKNLEESYKLRLRVKPVDSKPGEPEKATPQPANPAA